LGIAVAGDLATVDRTAFFNDAGDDVAGSAAD
jgi:hypothetical protein